MSRITQHEATRRQTAFIRERLQWWITQEDSDTLTLSGQLLLIGRFNNAVSESVLTSHLLHLSGGVKLDAGCSGFHQRPLAAHLSSSHSRSNDGWTPRRRGMGLLMHAQFSAATRINSPLRADDSLRHIVRDSELVHIKVEQITTDGEARASKTHLSNLSGLELGHICPEWKFINNEVVQNNLEKPTFTLKRT